MTNVSCSIPANASFATCSGVRSPWPDCGPLGIDRSMLVSTPCGHRIETLMPSALCEIAVLRKSDRRMLGRRIRRTSHLRQQAGGGNRVEEIPLPARLHAWDQMPRGIDMRHDMDRPASRPRLVGTGARVFPQRFENAADAPFQP